MLMLILFFFWFLIRGLSPPGYKNTCFSGSNVLPNGKETEVDCSNHKASQWAGKKNTGLILVSCRAWKCVPQAISGGADLFEVPECHLLGQMSSQLGSQKLLQGYVYHELTSYIPDFDLILTQ